MDSPVRSTPVPRNEASADPKGGQVRRHFEMSAAEFDAIYTGRKSVVGRWLDRTLRRDMFERLEHTVREVKAMGAVSVLDVGCGSGVFSVPLAREGVNAVVGVDFSRSMIEMAVQRAAAAGLSSPCKFMVGDFRLLDFPQPFDCSLAIGVFDYLAAPQPFLERMRRVTRRKLIATFPCRWTYRAPIRKVRLAMLRCPVYFYSGADVRRLFRPLSASRLRIRRIGHILLVVAEFDPEGDAGRSPAAAARDRH